MLPPAAMLMSRIRAARAFVLRSLASRNPAPRALAVGTLAVLLWISVPLRARAVAVEAAAARTAAAAFLDLLHEQAAPAGCSVVADDGGTLAYLFGVAASEGYVVIAADDELPPVIAYSLESDSPSGGDPDNPLLRLVRADLRSRLRGLRLMDPAQADSLREAARRTWSALLSPATPQAAEPGRSAPFHGGRFEQWPPEGSTPTGGWILTNWTQSAPYNALCPLDLAHGGTRSLAGCPAVAMAMILNYHGTIQETAFGAGDRYWHSYAGNNYWIPDGWAQYGFPDFPLLNGHLQTLSQHWDEGAPLTNTDKAALIFACGVAERQVYSASVSGTFGVDQAYAAFQRFGFNESRLVFDSDPELYQDLAAEMQIARPAHLAVVDPGWTVGHNLVVDGWNTDNYFHLNFGWGGSYNGWYLLPEGMPYNLTVIEGVILDIAPAALSAPEAGVAVVLPELVPAPNPFRPRVTLTFAAPERGPARLAAYDVSGRMRAVLWNGEIPAGPHSLVWSPGRLPAGSYWLRFEVGGQTVTRQVVYLR